MFIWLPNISCSWSNCLCAKVYHCCFCAYLLRLTWYLSSCAWKSQAEKLCHILSLLKAQMLSTCYPSPQNCVVSDSIPSSLTTFFEDPMAILKYEQFMQTLKFNRNSLQTFRNITPNTEITYANKILKHCEEAMLLSTQDCCTQRQASV